MFTSKSNDAFSMSCSWSGTCSPSIPALLKARSSRPNSADGPFHQSLRILGFAHVGHLEDRDRHRPARWRARPLRRAWRCGCRSQARRRPSAIAKAVALPMPVPPPVTMPTLFAKDVMSVPPRGRSWIPGADATLCQGVRRAAFTNRRGCALPTRHRRRVSYCTAAPL